MSDASKDSDPAGARLQGIAGIILAGGKSSRYGSNKALVEMNGTRLIDRVYVSKLELCCEANGNVEGDELDKINLADITSLIDHVYVTKIETAACE